MGTSQKNRGTSSEVPIIRAIAHWGPYCPIQGNSRMYFICKGLKVSGLGSKFLFPGGPKDPEGL